MTPLAPGHLLADRFEIAALLGRGGFGIAYVAHDRQRDDQVVIKELAPEGSQRNPNGLLELRSGAATPQVLRQRFIDEAQMLSRLRIEGILPVRSAWTENGTAYYATDYLPSSRTLEDDLGKRRLSAETAEDIFNALLDILEQVHEKGILHRDIKPSNILIGPKGEVVLIDFGSAREFLSDSANTHTVMYTPGYAPPEQLSERARRGPATDLFSLCATAYQMLTGHPPEDVAERMAGQPLTPLPGATNFERAIETGLRLNYAERPQTADDLRHLLVSSPDSDAEPSIEALDNLLCRARRFTFHKGACPSCQEPLDAPKPLKRFACPTCRKGTIRQRRIDPTLCPICKDGKLKQVPSDQICPHCQTGVLQITKRGILKKETTTTCPICKEHSSIPSIPSVPHRACPSCSALFQPLPDGRRKQLHPKPKTKIDTLYPEEWANLAAGLDPGSGNAECDLCAADYFLDHEHLTLLDTPHDPFGFAADYLGRLITVEDARWLGIGKQSPRPGLVCGHCQTELDQDGDYLRLVRSPSRAITAHSAQPRKLADWHRIGQGLPTVDQEETLEEQIAIRLADAYLDGTIGFDPTGKLAWSGEAIRHQDQLRSTLTISETEITFGGLLRKWRIPVDALLSATAHEDYLSLHLTGDRDPHQFTLTPQTLYIHLPSGDRTLELEATDLAERLTRAR